MIVVSDAGPLDFPGAAGHLGLLRDLFDRVVVPEAVWREVLTVGPDRPGAAATRASTWIQVMRADEGTASRLREQLDPGEAEAIVLAAEIKADVLLIDDQAGRRVATDLGLAIIGTLGVLLHARRAGLLPAVRPVIEAFVRLGFHATPELVEKVAALAGE
jgi:predicted nucleic acid-binding protein